MERDRRGTPVSAEGQPGPDADALSLAQVEAVLRRAAQIDAQQRTPGASAGLATEEVTRIALEAGLTPAAVDAALRELKLGDLGKEQKQALLDKYVGARVVRSARVVEMPPEIAASSLRRLLEEELLEPFERHGSRTVWGPQLGLRANVMRTVRRGWMGAGDFRKMELISDVRPADPSGQKSIVAMEARLEGRANLVAGPAVLAAVTGIGTLALGVAGFGHLAQHMSDATQYLWASGSVAVAGGALTLITGSSVARAWRDRLRRIRVTMDKLLDGL
jgi:hypothetical protein